MLFAEHELDLLDELITSFLDHLRELKKKSSGEAAETLIEMISQMNTTLKKVRGREKADETDLDIFTFLLKEIRLKPAQTKDAVEFSDRIKDLRGKVAALQKTKKNRLNSDDWRKGLSPSTQKDLEGYSERDRDRELERIRDRAYWFKIRSKTKNAAFVPEREGRSHMGRSHMGRSHIRRRSKRLKINWDNDE